MGVVQLVLSVVLAILGIGASLAMGVATDEGRRKWWAKSIGVVVILCLAAAIIVFVISV